MKITGTALMLSLLLFSTPLFAVTTIHVPTDQATIQSAINAAAAGDTVLVSDGTYFEHIDFKGKAITVTSVNGAASTIIDGQLTTVPVVTFQTGESVASVLRGFTVRNGGATFGSGISLSNASPTIVNNIFDSNRQGAGGYGAGIGGNNASPVIQQNLFRNNSCDTQWTSGVISFVNTSSPVIANNLIVGNNCRGINMTLPSGSLPVIINNTLVGNPVGIRVDARIPTSASIYANNIIASNVIGLQVDFLVSGNEPTWKHNLLYNNTTNYSGIADQTGSNGNFVADPLFVNPPLDLHLVVGATAGSPAVDAGDNTVPRLPTTDYDGKTRVVDGTNICTPKVDLGAYEYQAAPQATFAPSLLTFAAQLVGTSSSAQSANLSNTGTTCLHISGFTSTDNFSQTNTCAATLAAGQSCSVSVTFTPTAAGTRSGALGVSSDSPANAVLSLAGTGTTPVATLAPAALTFAAQSVGSISNAQVFTLTNTGNAPLHISAITATGDFAQVNNCPATLAATAFCSFSITFKPTAAGSRTGSVTISDDALFSQQQSVSLTGTGVDFALSATPASVTVNSGGSAKYTVVVSAVGGTFASAVSFQCSGLPASASCSFSPASLSPRTTSASATMIVTTTQLRGKKGTPSGTSNITITGASGSLAHSATVTLVVK